MPPLPSFIPQVLAAIGAGLAVVGFCLLVAAGEVRKRALRREIDRLHDEVWELREAAAERDPRGSRERGEVALPRQRQPRGAHAAERHLGNGRAFDRQPARCRAADLCGGDPVVRQRTRLAHRRDPRPVEDRGRQGSSCCRKPSTSSGWSKASPSCWRRARKARRSRSPARWRATCPSASSATRCRLRQVLLNIAGNAVKFTEQGGVGIRVARDPRGAEWLRFDVVDTGPGIPAGRRGRRLRGFPAGRTSLRAAAKRHRARLGDFEAARRAHGRDALAGGCGRRKPRLAFLPGPAAARERRDEPRHERREGLQRWLGPLLGRGFGRLGRRCAARRRPLGP